MKQMLHCEVTSKSI